MNSMHGKDGSNAGSGWGVEVPVSVRRSLTAVRPESPAQLHAWLRVALGIVTPREPLVGGHCSPFDYLCHAFFEPTEAKMRAGSAPPRDAVIWAARGAGKTFYAAVATALDLIFKPGVEVRILGGSLDQSRRMHEHLKALFERDELAGLLSAEVSKPLTERRVLLANGSRAEVLSQSHTSVRGTRPHKLRCDEVDLFDEDVWHAAQYTTRSEELGGRMVWGAVEALSTWHRVDGVMGRLIGSDDATERRSDEGERERDEETERQRDGVRREARGRAVFRWSVIDVLERCGEERACDGCGLWDECRGAAKGVDPEEPGHVSVADALTLKGRSPAEHWGTEMLCEPPRERGAGELAVLPEFDEARHVRRAWPSLRDPVLVAGMDFGLRSPTVVVFAVTERSETFRVIKRGTRGGSDAGAAAEDSLRRRAPVHVIGEYAASDVLLPAHVLALRRHPALDAVPGGEGLAWVAVDPAGSQRNDQTGVSPIQMLAESGLTVRHQRTLVDDGVRLVRSRLIEEAAAERTRDGGERCGERGTGSGERHRPLLTVDPRCVELIRSMRSYRYDRATGKPVKDGPDHAVDALRYLLVVLEKGGKTEVVE